MRSWTSTFPRPRNDPIAIRGTEEFQNKRYHIWRLLKLTDEPIEPTVM